MTLDGDIALDELIEQFTDLGAVMSAMGKAGQRAVDLGAERARAREKARRVAAYQALRR